MRFTATICILLALSIAISADWAPYCTQRECPDIMMDIVPVKNNLYDACICGGYSTSSMGVYCSRGNFTSFERIPMNNPSFMLTAMASNPNNSATATAGVGFEAFNSSSIMYSHDLHEFNPSQSGTSTAFGQDIKYVHLPGQPIPPPQHSSFGFVGTIDDINTQGILLSSNGGKDFIPIPWDASIPYQIRYGTFPAANVFYATGGTFPSATPNQEMVDRNNQCIRLSQHVCVPAKHLTQDMVYRINRRVYQFNSSAATPSASSSPSSRGNLDGRRHQDATLSDTGYYGVITKYNSNTKQWEKVYETDELYFNDISCSTVDHCIAVGEGLPYAHVFYTNNGGKTWTKSLTLQSDLLVSLFRARFIQTQAGDLHAFVSGGYFDMESMQLLGVIYKSLDGGQTWTLDGSYPGVGIFTGLNFDEHGRVGYAVGSTQSNTSIVLKYTP